MSKKVMLCLIKVTVPKELGVDVVLWAKIPGSDKIAELLNFGSKGFPKKVIIYDTDNQKFKSWFVAEKIKGDNKFLPLTDEQNEIFFKAMDIAQEAKFKFELKSNRELAKGIAQIEELSVEISRLYRQREQQLKQLSRLESRIRTCQTSIETKSKSLHGFENRLERHIVTKILEHFPKQMKLKV